MGTTTTETTMTNYAILTDLTPENGSIAFASNDTDEFLDALDDYGDNILIATITDEQCEADRVRLAAVTVVTDVHAHIAGVVTERVCANYVDPDLGW
jgi:hypothetical protein